MILRRKTPSRDFFEPKMVFWKIQKNVDLIFKNSCDSLFYFIFWSFFWIFDILDFGVPNAESAPVPLSADFGQNRVFEKNTFSKKKLNFFPENGEKIEEK